MYAGRFVETGTARQVVRRAMHPYTQGLLSSACRQDEIPMFTVDTGAMARCVRVVEPVRV
jgi:ABC-type dipeptide/oligopeptide/nickel transport system ATPase component